MRISIRAFSRGALATLLLAGVVGATSISPAAAATSGLTGQHCIVHVVGEQSDSTFVLGPQRCYGTFAEVLRSQGLTTVSNSIQPSTVTSAVLRSAFIIGTHFDGSGYTGSSFSVSGGNCSGGGLNVPLAWNDRISSTINGCDQIVHYEDSNYLGGTYTTFSPGGNITGYMDNKTSSIRYY